MAVIGSPVFPEKGPAGVCLLSRRTHNSIYLLGGIIVWVSGTAYWERLAD